MKAFDKGSSLAGGDIPVNRAHFVAGLVFAHLIKFHAGTAKRTFVFAGHHIIDRLARAYLDIADFFGQFFWNHMGIINHEKHENFRAFLCLSLLKKIMVL